MSLKQDAHDFSNRELKVILVVVFLLNDFEIIIVNLIVFIISISVFRHVVVLLDSFIRLVVHVYQQLRENIHNFLCKQAFTYFIDDLLCSLHLADQCVGLGLLVDCFPEAV
jgi:hypothetical protein